MAEIVYRIYILKLGRQCARNIYSLSKDTWKLLQSNYQSNPNSVTIDLVNDTCYIVKIILLFAF